jgi:hypothetical protein
MVRAILFLGGLTLGVLAGLCIATYSDSVRVSTAESRATELETATADQRARLEAATKELEAARAELTQMADLRASSAADKHLLEQAQRDAKDRWIANRVLSAENERLQNELQGAARQDDAGATSGHDSAFTIQSNTTVDGFKFSGLILETVEDGCLLRGKVTNNTGRDYAVAFFTVSLYDTRKSLIDVMPVSFSQIADGETKAFSEEFPAREARDTTRARTFEIAFESGV